MSAMSLSDSLGVVSVIIGVLGFGATLVQLARIKSTADAANLAVEGLKTRISHMDALQEVAHAEAAVSALRADIKSLSSDRWNHWTERLENSLIVISELSNGSRLGTDDKIGVATRQVSYLAKQSELEVREGAQARDKVREALRDISRALVAVKAQIQRSQ